MFDYEIYVDIDRDGLFANGLGDISKYVISCSWNTGLASPWDDLAGSGRMTLLINNAGGQFGLTDTSSTYYGLINHGSLVRVRIIKDGIKTQMAVLKIKDFQYFAKPDKEKNPMEHQLQIVCEDPIRTFLEQDFTPELRLNVRVDEALTEIFEQAQFIYPYDGAWFYIGTSEIGGSDIIYDYTQEDLLDFEEAYSILPYTGDNMDRGNGVKIQSYLRDILQAEFNGIFFWNVRTEQFKFLHRHHNLIAQKSPFIQRTSSHTFDMRDIASANPAYSKDLVNDVTVNYYPRTVGSPGSVVASSSAVPFALAAGSERFISMRYRDENNPSASIGALDVIPPRIGFDAIGNSEDDGSGDDWTRYLDVDLAHSSGEEALVRVYAKKVGDPIYVTTLQIRGTPIISYQRESVTVVDGESRRLYDRAVLPPISARAISDYDMAEQYANQILGVRKTPDLFMTSITLIPKDETIADQILERTIGDVITIRDSRNEEINYMIVGEKHDIKIEVGMHMTDWILRPIKHGTPFIIGTSEIGGSDIILV